ncbi:hypothetical protein MHC_03605 [Mycoplasma haemocanis str. Illinois]|uniref:Uncharacterized protein n=1 Tax=Mycoplasma haemocanis (strain Illinois) TaxID=1111676 RepID=H6N7F9_MYCHN|nr:hypothetical protein [Mycoplasma haemocanis]AEW45581.1 hypothetical protein MHC_03605 [Mycoplasma haemocanis str. Illinois]
MGKLSLVYLATGTAAVGSAGVGGYIYFTRGDTSPKEQKKRSISEVLKEAKKTILSTDAGSSNTHSAEWNKRKEAYANALDTELIADIGESGQETSIAKSSSVDVEKMKKWCKKYLDSDFSSAEDAVYKKALKWCTKEAQ